ncbi:MAG: hypothetical protein GY757_07120 [bacterium]|nr:hypothetical protein [bacterium]
MKKTQVLFLLLLLSTSLYPRLSITGFVDTYHSVRLKAPNDFLSSRTRMRLEMEKAVGKTRAYVTFNLTHNSILESDSGIHLREAWVEYAADTWEIRMGRQIVPWGKGDGVQVTDIISPMDYSEFLARDFDDIRLPVTALRFRKPGNKSQLELIWVFQFQPAVFAPADSPWAAAQPDITRYDIIDDQTVMPGKNISNGELFAKLSFYLSGMDLAISGFVTRDDYGAVKQTVTRNNNRTTLQVATDYYRTAGMAVEFSIPRGNFVFRGETALFFGKKYQPIEPELPLYKKKTIQSLAGIDWYGKNDWMISAQLADNFITGWHSSISNKRHTLTATLNVSKNLLRQTLTLTQMLYVGLNHMDFFQRFTIDYTLVDNLHLIAGLDILGGKKGLFSAYKDNTEIFFKAKLSF